MPHHQQQLSLFGDERAHEAPGAAGAPDDGASGHGAAARQAPWAGYASVIVDIATRSLSEPFAYAVPEHMAEDIEVGCIVLVRFGARRALGYVVALAPALAQLPGTDDLDDRRIRPIEQRLTGAEFSPEAARLAAWMSREYVAPLAEALRLFLPPGGTPRLRHDEDGYHVERPAVPEIHERVVSLTPEGRDFVPAANASRQRQLIEALSCGPVTTRELNLLYTDMSAAIRTLEKRGVVRVDERRAWRGTGDSTTLSSARAAAPKELTRGQTAALDAIEHARARGAGDVVVVDGVTGSGKTEVYLAAIERTLAQGRSACVLVPEISLTAQTVGRFRSRFGETVAVFHSRLSAGERLDQWDMVHTGAARVVVGARSALFCPFCNLGIIIIDEEHEQSYKQGTSPRYHAREVAAQMARMQGIPLVLGSATPSAEALFRCRTGEVDGQRWERVEMPERPGGAVLPTIHIADLRRDFTAGSRSMFSRPLHEALLEVAERREKAVLLHNRRGFAPFLMCRECGCVPTCAHCSTALTYHERTHTLACHTCGAQHRVQAYPSPSARCPECGSPYLAKMGLGTQQVEDALVQLLPPHVEVIRMDADSTRGKDGHKRLLEQFDAAPCAVLLGTQMIAKGLDFPEVTLVGVVMADYALKMPDFRAQERAYDLLEQVAGRAGRGERPGRVIIQTYVPQDPVMRAVAAHDRAIFTEHDFTQRADAGYPPFVRLSNVLFWGARKDEVLKAAGRFASALKQDIAKEMAGEAARSRFAGTPSIASIDGATDPTCAPVVLGPSSCVIERAKDRWRFHVMVKSPLGYHISDTISHALQRTGAMSGVSVSVDIDAYDLM